MYLFSPVVMTSAIWAATTRSACSLGWSSSYQRKLSLSVPFTEVQTGTLSGLLAS